MKIIHEAIRYPVTTAVGVILLVLFGAISLFLLPIQLTPTVEDPIVTVATTWPGASPLEIEREIIQEQEEQLKSLEGLRKMESQSSDSSGVITLTFQVGTRADSALLRVSNLLEQVPEYPRDANKPVITSVDSDAGAVAWFVLRPTEENGFAGDMATLYDYVDDFVKPEFERVPGVATSGFFGGRPHEMQVIVDPARLATSRVTLNELATALDRENRNYSGGDFDEGKRRYIVRTVGEYTSAQEIDDIVIAVRDDVPVYLRDVGHAEMGYRKPGARVFHMGEPILAINVTKETGSNLLAVLAGVRETAQQLNEGRLADRGLFLTQVYDESDYVHSSIRLVLQSLLIGGALAILVLLIYLRSASSTLIIAVAIPISVIGAFAAMKLFGRTLNVLSLAGMAFAAGMVVDNSLVVLENIYRHRQMGKSRHDAAFDGTREVWGAVLASTLTTIAVFVPIVFMVGEVGELFGDIGLAISCSVGLSLIVAITVIPSLSAKMLGGSSRREGSKPLGGLTHGAARITTWVADLVYRINGSMVARLTVVLGFTVAAMGFSYLLLPKAEYLPLGNQNFIFGQLLPPPGYSLDEVSKLGQVITSEMQYLWEHPAGSPEAQALAGGGIRDYFFVALPSFAFMGASTNDTLRAAEVIPEFMKANRVLPGSIFFMSQRSIFERGRGAGRNIDIEIKGPDLEHLIGLGGAVFGQVMQKLPSAQAFPRPSLDLGNPEVRVLTNRRRAAEAGISNRELGFAVSALVDGAKASDFQFEGKEIDLRLKVPQGFAHRTHLLEQMPIATSKGNLVTLGSVADVSVVNGPVQINHSERQRTIAILVSPEERMELEAAMDTIRSEILQPMRDAGRLGGLYRVELTGTAQKLSQTLQALKWNLLLVLAITFLLLAALFEDFLYPLVIMLSVPMAALGGFLGLATVNLFTYQAMDVLTMLGFVILIGTVVNNAILIVHQSLNHIRNEGLAHREAIREAVRNRMRPIFMSVSTSTLGMLPLVLFPGAGSELYRGLGSVVMGGLLVSTLFTLFLVPALFSLTLDLRAALARAFARGSESAA